MTVLWIKNGGCELCRRRPFLERVNHSKYHVQDWVSGLVTSIGQGLCSEFVDEGSEFV